MEKNYSNIKLSSLTGLFCNSNALEFLKGYEIITVGDLLEKSVKEDFYNALKVNKNTYRDVVNAIKLLKCKYLDVDPLVRIDEDDSILDFGNEIGLSTKAIYALARKQVTIEELINMIKKGTTKTELAGAYNLGEKGISEIVFKTSIVVDYYSTHENSNFTIKTPIEETKTEDEKMYHELLKMRKQIEKTKSEDEKMYYELLEMRKQANDLVSKMDTMLDKLLERMVSQETEEKGKFYTKGK